MFNSIRASLALGRWEKQLNRLLGQFDNLVTHNVARGDARYRVVAEEVRKVMEVMISDYHYTETSLGIAYPKLDQVFAYTFEEEDTVSNITNQIVPLLLPVLLTVLAICFVYTTYHAGMVDWYYLLTAPTRW